MSEGIRHIVLVEDQEADVILFRRALRQAGLNLALTVLGDGDAAIAYLEGRDPYHDRNQFPLPDLMVLDIRLPRRSGWDVLAWRRDHPPVRDLPFVLLSTSREPEEEARAASLGVRRYLTKPAKSTELASLLEGLYRENESD